MYQYSNPTGVTVLPNYTLLIRFADGKQGRLRLPDFLPLTRMFASLASPEFFEEVFIDHGTLCWPGDIDLDPAIVYHWALGLPIASSVPQPA